jgi:hypothetical protein
MQQVFSIPTQANKSIELRIQYDNNSNGATINLQLSRDRRLIANLEFKDIENDPIVWLTESERTKQIEEKMREIQTLLKL